MNGVTRISSEQDVMMITFTEADTASALADALTAFAQKRRRAWLSLRGLATIGTGITGRERRRAHGV